MARLASLPLHREKSMSEQDETPSNFSKQLGGTDDSAAQFLQELLNGSVGRNFDIESLFLEKKDGQWKWTVFEFLKRDSPRTTVQKSHPNRYWLKNKRKFLSLWTVVKCFRKAGFGAELILVNYDDDREFVKTMRVETIDPNAEEPWTYQGQPVPNTKNWVVTRDKVWSFADFQAYFYQFNRDKQGETWEALAEL